MSFYFSLYNFLFHYCKIRNICFFSIVNFDLSSCNFFFIFIYQSFQIFLYQSLIFWIDEQHLFYES